MIFPGPTIAIFLIIGTLSRILPDVQTHRCGPSGRGAGTSQNAPLAACAGTTHLRRVWAYEGRELADAYVRRLPCSEVLQRRSPEDGFEKSRIRRKPENGAAQGYLQSAQQVARDVVKDGMAPDSCTAELVVFLQR